MTLSEHQAAFLLDVCTLVPFATALGYTVTGGELARTIEQQQIYWNTGKTKTMKSNHLKRLAIDLNFIKNNQMITDPKELEPIGRHWVSLNPLNRWGGNFDGDWNPKTGFMDAPHFERNL
jgi:hypothetical protein